jgi:hypothetical protein
MMLRTTSQQLPGSNASQKTSLPAHASQRLLTVLLLSHHMVCWKQ